MSNAKSVALLAVTAIGLGCFSGCGPGVSNDPIGRSGGRGGASAGAVSVEAGAGGEDGTTGGAGGVTGSEGGITSGAGGITGGEAGTAGEPADTGGAGGITGGEAGAAGEPADTGGAGGVTGGAGGAGGEGGGRTFTRCSSDGAFGAPKAIAGLPPGSVRLRLNPDETEAYFVRDYPAGGAYEIVRARRANRDADFDETTATIINVNDSEDFFSPTMAPGGLLYFENDEDNGFYSRIYQTAWNAKNDSFGPIELVPGLRAENATYTDESPYVTPSGGAMYFHSGRLFRQGLGYEAIFRAEWNGETFLEPELVEVEGSRGHPVVSPDELTLYLTRNPIGDAYSADIYQVTRAEKSLSFGRLKLVEGPNEGVYNDLASFISEDGCRLYFDRNYRGVDESAWVVERAPDTE